MIYASLSGSYFCHFEVGVELREAVDDHLARVGTLRPAYKWLAQKNRKRGPHRKRYSPLIVYRCVCALAELVDDDTRAELRLEPCGLRWHDVARVSDVHDLLHRDGVEG